MTAEWMLYSVAISAALGLSAHSLEFGLRRRAVPLRMVWIASICGSVALGAAPWFGSAEAHLSAPADAGPTVVTAPVERSTMGPGAGAASPLPAVEARTGRTRDASFLERLDPLLLPVWGMASAAAMLVLLRAQRRLARRRRIWRRAVLDGVPVLVSRDTGPAVVGFVDTAIVLPEWILELDPGRKRLVLAHEVEHVRAGDARLLSAALVLSALVPWNVPLWWQLRRLRHAVELDCDSRVLKGARDAEAYCELLIEVGERASLPRWGLATFAESASLLAGRIRNITAPRPRAWKLAVGSCLSVAGLLLAAACETPTPALRDRAVPGAQRVTAGPPRPDTAPASAAETGDSTSSPGPDAKTPSSAPPEPVAATSALAVPEPASAAAGPEPAYELELVAQGRHNMDNILELVRLRHPEVRAAGLPVDSALWFAIDAAGRIRRSWVGPNLLLDFDIFQPMAFWHLPEGSPEYERGRAEHARAVGEVLSANAPEMQVRGKNAVHFYRPSRITLHFLTEAPGTPAWGGRDTLALDIVVRTSEPIANVPLPLLTPDSLSWGGESWLSRAPARRIPPEQLRRVGEIGGRAIFVEAGLKNPDVIYRLEQEPDLFLPFVRTSR